MKNGSSNNGNTPAPSERKGKSALCEIRGSDVHGRGLFATRDIKEGERIIEYIGEKITKGESNRRGWAQMETAQKTGDAAVYIFILNKRHDVDGNVPSNDARLINHSCEPNCEAQIIRGRIWIVATRPVARGEELGFNYGFDLESFEDHPCRCGAGHCVGYIAGEEYWPKLKRTLKKRAKKAEKSLKKAEKKKKKADKDKDKAKKKARAGSKAK